MSLPSKKVLWARCLEHTGWSRVIRCPNCPPELVMDVRRGCSSKESASSSHDSPQPVDLFWVPDKRTLVEAIECVMSEQMPSIEGPTESFLKDCKRDMNVDAGNLSTVKATFPSTPATVCASMCSTTTPATRSGISSNGWSEFSEGNTPQECVPSPSSSSSTDLELEATQLDPSIGHQIDESADQIRSDVCEKPGAGVNGTGSGANTLIREGSSSETRGAKRPRESTPHAFESWQEPDGAGPVLPPAEEQRSSDASSPELPGDFGSAQRKRECLARSQYPRLDGHPTPAARSRSQRESDLKADSIRCVQGDATGGMFNHMLGSPQPSCRERKSQKSPERADGAKAKDVDGDGSEKVPPGSLRAQDSMDTCEATARPHSCDSSDRCIGDGMDLDGVEVKASSTRDNDDAASSVAEQVGLGWPGVGELSSQAPSEDAAKTAIEDPKAVDAAGFARVGISGDEDWRSMKSKLTKLGWKFPNSLVNKLERDYWVLKPAATVRNGEPGVDKFAGYEKAAKYVRDALQLLDNSQSDTEDEHGEEMGEDWRGVDRGQAQGTGEEERGQGVESDVMDHEDERNGELKQGELSAFTAKERALEAALEALNPSNAPDVLQQRTTEFEQVLHFVTTSVSKSSGGSLYLCGVPGTGKTQTMVNVKAKVLEKFSKGKTPAPAFHSFTGTEFTSPTAMHDALWRAITGAKEIEEGIDIEKKLGNKLKYQRKMATASSPMLLVVLDEIDQLMTHNREVLLKLFEWADRPKSRLILVGLANSLDFDVNFSHLEKAPQRLLFQSYTPEDLASILTERVGATVHRSAIQFCAKKAAATTGDARRAINMCREAVVLAKQELQTKLDDTASEEERLQVGTGNENDLVTISHMAKAVAAGNAGKYSAAIAGLSFHAKVVLAVAAAAVGDGPDRRGGSGSNAGKCSRLSQGDLHEKCMGAWRRLKTGEVPGQLEFTGIIDILAASGLVALKSKRQTGGRARELVLRIEFADLAAALEDQPFFKTVTDS